VGSALQRLDGASSRFISHKSGPAGRVAFKRLQKERAGYGVGEPDAPARGVVVPLQVEQIDLPSVAPVAIGDLSRRALAICTPENMIGEAETSEEIRAYSDPRLRRKDVQLQLASRLWDAGILRRVRKRIGKAVSMFSVTKKPGHQRLVFDLRVTNAGFKRPPRIELGSVEAFACLDLSRVGPKELDAYGGDIQVWFYSILTPEWLWPFFTLDVGADELAAYRGSPLAGVGTILAFAVPLMGWSWAPALAQLCLEDLLAGTPDVNIRAEGALTSRCRAQFAKAALLHSEYLDDFTLLALISAAAAADNRGPAQDAGRRIKKHLENVGLVVHKEQVGLPLEFLGCVLEEDDGKFRIAPTRAKLWLAYEATLYLVARQNGSAREVARLVGHWVWFCMVARSYLSIFNAVYGFMTKYSECAGRSVPLWDSVLSELASIAAMAPLLESDLSAEWVDEIACVDAGPEAGAVCYLRAPADFARDVGYGGEAPGSLDTGSCAVGQARRSPQRAEERASEHASHERAEERTSEDASERESERASERSAHEDPPLEKNGHEVHDGSAPDSLCSLCSLSRTAVLAGDDDIEAIQVWRGAAPVGLDVMSDTRERAWKLAIMVEWKTAAHNNVQEAVCILFALQRAARNERNCGKRYVVCTDSLVALGALVKGRSSSFSLNLVCRKVLAVLASTGLKLYLRYVPTWLNIADGPSRLVRQPGVFADTVRKAIAKHQRLGIALPDSLEYVSARLARHRVIMRLQHDIHPHPGPVEAQCKKGHSLTEFATPVDGYSCDVCSRDKIPRGTRILRCKGCDYDMCDRCVAQRAAHDEPGPRAAPPRPTSRRDAKVLVWSDWSLPGCQPSALAWSLTLRHAVCGSTSKLYWDGYSRFRDFLRGVDRVAPLTPSRIDELLCLYVDFVFAQGDEEGKSFKARAKNAFFGLLYAYPNLKGSMPLAAASLDGFHRLRPTAERSPLPWGALGIVAAEGLRGHVAAGTPRLGEEFATTLLTTVDSFLRHSEFAGLRRGHVAAAGRQGLALLLGRDAPTKTGRNEGTVVELDAARSMLSSYMTHLSLAPDALLFPHHELFAGQLSSVARRLGLGNIVPHELRHSGASHFARTLRWSANDVMLRGRWKNVSSVQRYAKPHVLVEAWSLLPPDIARAARKFEADPLGIIGRARQGLPIV